MAQDMVHTRGETAGVQNKKAELLPCPFCGAKEGDKSFPALWETDDCLPGQEWHVYCWNCEAQSRGDLTPALAIDRWNNRAPDPVRADLLAALKDARNYVDAVVANATNPKRRLNYTGCVQRVDAAIAKAEGLDDGRGTGAQRSGATS